LYFCQIHLTPCPFSKGEGECSPINFTTTLHQGRSVKFCEIEIASLRSLVTENVVRNDGCDAEVPSLRGS
jgi:hypothetical protein